MRPFVAICVRAVFEKPKREGRERAQKFAPHHFKNSRFVMLRSGMTRPFLLLRI
jgi:hypothetical protein